MALTTTNGLTANQLVTLLLGPGVTFSNASLTGTAVASGSFSGGLSEGLGIDDGVILSSGNIANAVGPNNSDGKSTANGTAGDAALTAIAGNPTFDASILQFDFVPTSTNVSFKYVFASEEYNEFVPAAFNDVFAFFLNGQNIALIPCSTIPITIKNVNTGTNSGYFNNNDFGDLGPNTPFGTQFDGFTKVLTAQAEVTPGQTYTIRMAIADTADAALDSAVFLKAGSFTFGTPDLSATITSNANSVAVGSPITYTIVVSNNGNVDANCIDLQAALPTGFALNSVTVNDNFSAVLGSNNILTLERGIIPGNSTSTITIVGTPSTAGSGTINLVADPDNKVNESNENNNTASITTTFTANNTTSNPTGTPGITVIPTQNLSTTKAGGKNSFSIVLNSAPTSTVTIPISSSNTNEGIVNPTFVSFSPTNFNTPQTVTIQGVNDFTTGNIPYTIILSPAISADSRYNGLDPQDLSVVNLDVPEAGNVTRPNSTPSPVPTPSPAPSTDSIILGTVANDFLGPYSGDNIIRGLTGDDTIRGGQGNDLVEGNQGRDDLNGNAGNDTVRGGQDNDTVRGGQGDDLLFGGAGSDFINGNLGNDTLTGAGGLFSNNPGIGEVDTLAGGGGSNVFVLGDNNRAYYDDGITNNPGYSDYALIQDFNSSQDFIQLKGGFNYLVGSSPVAAPVGTAPSTIGLPQGTAIYVDSDGTPGLSGNDELIAILQGNSFPNPVQSRFIFV